MLCVLLYVYDGVNIQEEQVPVILKECYSPLFKKPPEI